MRTILLFIIISFSAANASANDTFVYDNGHSVYPVETDDVRMVSEKVQVHMHEGAVSVKCSFVFRNMSDADVKAKLGFPARPDDRIYIEEEQAEAKPPLSNFRSRINGKQVDVTIKLDKSQREWMYWYIWEVDFPPKKQMRLQTEYKTGLSMDYYHKWFEYILTTGANWKGPIGNATIEVVYESNEKLKDRVLYICPERYKIKDNKIVWQFDNFVPDGNILVYERGNGPLPSIRKSFVDRFGKSAYKGNARRYVENDLIAPRIDTDGLEHVYASSPCLKEEFARDLNKEFARLLRNEIFARHGRIFKSGDLREIFQSTAWYKPNPGYSDEMLNDLERRNVQFILDYEKDMGWR